MKKLFILSAIIILSISLLNAQKMETKTTTSTKSTSTWKKEFSNLLNRYGHRNWILVTDKAFPMQNSAGMIYLDTNEDLLPALKYVLDEIKSSKHVKPIIYTDKELQYITEKQVIGVTEFYEKLGLLLKDMPVNTMLHEDVFKVLDESSKLFSVLVLKTNCTIPYSSVFINLDCAYWNSDKEQALRMKIKDSNKK